MEGVPASTRIVGRYLIHDAIAAGGMATVHLGRLLGPVGFTRTVAIKRLHAQYASDPEFVAMFIDEARLAARIRHPNVIQTLDVVASGGEVFLVMDYVQGESLSRLRRLAADRGQTVPLRVVTSVFCGALHGLHAAHEAKSDQGKSLDIVHRDVSPQNILLGTDGIARLLDFGIAKAMGRAHNTQDGRLKGKLAYMAPEQLEGKVSRRTDVFAAAIVLWETLTDQRLFAGQDEVEVVGNILEKPIEPPSKSMQHRPEAASLGPLVLDRLDAVTLRGLSRRPEDRFETAREMALALEACFGVASPAEVGQWVESVAGGVFDDRAKLLAEIESQTSARGPASVPQPTVKPGQVSPNPSAPVVAPEVGTQASSVSLTTQNPVRQTQSWLGTAVVAVVAAVAVSVAFAFLRSGGQAERVTAPAVAVANAPAPPTSASSEAQPSPTQAQADTPPVAPLPSTAASNVPSASPADASHAGVRKRAAPDCTTPYVVDAEGHKHFKEECFH